MNTAVKGNIKLGAGLCLAAIVIVFTVQNVQSAQLKFLVWQAEISLSLMIFGILAVGIAVGWLLASWTYYRRNRQKRFAEKAAKA